MVTRPSPANWYADPGRRFAFRYFDGDRWTDHVTDVSGNVTSKPLPPDVDASPPDIASISPHAVPEIPLLTVPTVPGRSIVEVFGLLMASAVMSRDSLSDFGSDVASFGGGPLRGIERAINVAAQTARQRLFVQAFAVGADCIIGLNVGLETVSDKAQAIFMTGTGVRTAPIDR